MSPISCFYIKSESAVGQSRFPLSFKINEKDKKRLFCLYTGRERSWGGNDRRQWHPTPVLLPGKSHGRRSLVGSSPWGRWESGRTERLHFHFSLSCIGEGNGNPLQCSCLENPRDGGAWRAAVYWVAQSRTRLKRLSSSSKENKLCIFVPIDTIVTF